MKNKANHMIIQGAILALAGILTKIVGFAYRIPMANLLGEEGNGVYSVSFGIYNVALTLSSYSFPLAVSKLVSTRLAKRERKNAFSAFTIALTLSVAAGILSFLLLFFGADALEALYRTKGLAYPLKVLAPTTFAVALLGVFRGYFQGYGNMVPTALSQIFEQIVNAVVSIVATYFSLKAFASDPAVSARGAAGATMGTLAGALCALIFIILTFTSRLSYTKKQLENDITPDEKKSSVVREMLTTMLPIILSQTIYQIGFTIDDLLFSNILQNKGVESSAISSLQGVFNTQYTQLINIPIAISTAMAASALPAIVRLSVRREFPERRRKIESITKITTVIALPCAVGLAVLARPIVTLLFPSLVTYRTTAQNLLIFGSLGCVFYALSTITTSILQGTNRMRIPVVNAFLSFTLHIVLVFVLFKWTDLGIWARLIGDMTFPLVIAFLNFRMISKTTGFALPLKRTLLYPALASIIMGGAALAVYCVISLITRSMLLSLALAVIVAVSLYSLLLLKLPVFSKDELLELPKGDKISKLADKIRNKK